MLTRHESTERNPESGYTLLIVLLIVATILLITAAAAPNIYIEGRRERDEEMIWRGQQYVRAIGLYYKKYGHYPQTIDDLVKSNNQIRFLRQAYPDPMNREDGSWRLIYVGPGGVLINSVMYTNIAQVGLPMGTNAALGGIAPAAGEGSSGAAGQGAEAAGQNSGVGAEGVPGTAASAGEQNIPGAAAPTAGAPGSTPLEASPEDQSQPAPLNMNDVVGGSLVGVGSKIKRPSIKVFNGGTTYYQWEFIWKPPLAGVGGAAAGPQTPGTAATPGTTSAPGSNSTMPSTSPAPNSPPTAPETEPGQ
jgi:type II secretory pathway pseudopilin PulG